MSTLTLEAPHDTHDTIDLDLDSDRDQVLDPATALRLAIAHADLQRIQELVIGIIDLSDPASRPAGLAFTAIKHLGPRKTSEQHQALAWLCENGLYDDNYKLKAVVQRMIADGLTTY